MIDQPLNLKKRPIKFAPLVVVVGISNRAIDEDYVAGVNAADTDLRQRFKDTLLKWEKAPHKPGIDVEDSSGISEDLLFTQNAVAVRVELQIDLVALDENTRSIQSYIEEASSKFQMIMRVYEAGLARGERRGRRAIEVGE